MNLSIVIPVFNEETTILEILRRVNALKKICQIEVIVINDGSIEFTIYNHGWATNGFQYSLYDEWDVLIFEGAINENSEIIDVSLDLSSLSIDDGAFYTLSVNPINDQSRISQIGFYISEFLLGDINSDMDVNIQDVIELQELILAYTNTSSISDLNNDQNTDILDVISLVNIILIDNN